MRELLKEQKYLAIFFLLFLVIGGLIALFTEKGEILYWVNSHYSPHVDSFFKYITWVGGGLVPFIIFLTLFINFRIFAVLGAANLLSFGVIQFLKRIIFSSTNRPKMFFEEKDLVLNVVEGVTLFSHFSFPSGHSATAFALLLGLALFTKNRWVAVVCGVSALLVAFSRVYLAQHFFIDIYVGGIIGMLILFAVYAYFSGRNWFHKDWAKKPFIIGWDWKEK